MQPLWLVRQAIRSAQQQRNLEQLSFARLHMDYAAVHRAKNAPPMNDIAEFLPHSATWRLLASNTNLPINKAAAIEFLATYKTYAPEVEIAFEKWLPVIEAKAMG